ncbi:MAG: tRNA (guanosine(46)-N7)-methyltransferase TrmB [Lachnospiraceae bacterium]|nr:tRNA (guanosine(46)-N7)-methyltransferase TrmB [Lachnospiraceae bacterium]
MRLRNVPGAREEMLVNEYVVQNPEEKKGHWDQVFAHKSPLYIEIGMGKGQFITTLAARNKNINYVGIEKYSSALIKGVWKREEMEDCDNLLFLRFDAEYITNVFGSGEVDKIYLNFSDPWPKARHARRRLTSPEYLKRYEQMLSADGVVEFKTDNQDLFTFSLESVEEAGWELIASTRDLHADSVLNEGNVMTEYEERFSSMGQPICKLIARPKR